MQEIYPLRICPTEGCGRLLLYWKEQFLCQSCWKKYSLEETLEHPNPAGICRFVMKEAEVGKYFVCINCGKTIFLTNKEYEDYVDRMNLFFEDTFISNERRKSEEWISNFKKNMEEAHKIAEEASLTKDSIKNALRNWKPGDKIIFVDSEGNEIK